MALTSVTVTSNIHDVSTAGIGGTLLYRLSGVDIEDGEGIIVPVVESVPVASDGTSSATLWATDTGEIGQTYTVHFAPPATGSVRPEIRLGEFVLQAADAPTVPLRELLLRSGSVTPLTPALVQMAVDAATRAERAQSIARVLTVTSSRAIADTDAGALLRVNSASSVTLTIPTDATAGWSDTLVVSVLRDGAGACVIQAASGVTLSGVAAGNALIADQYQFAQLVRIGANDWRVTGWVTEVAA